MPNSTLNLSLSNQKWNKIILTNTFFVGFKVVLMAES